MNKQLDTLVKCQMHGLGDGISYTNLTAIKKVGLAV